MDSSTAQLTELTAQLDTEREARQQLDVENSRLQAGVVSHNGFNPRMGPITWMFWDTRILRKPYIIYNIYIIYIHIVARSLYIYIYLFICLSYYYYYTYIYMCVYYDANSPFFRDILKKAIILSGVLKHGWLGNP
jgi:hypothetical protein